MRLCLGFALVFLLSPPPSGRVIRYRCLVTRDNEILCFQPADGTMFRPERRFDSFILEVPTL